MKKIYIKPQSELFISSYKTETMQPGGTHSIDPYQEKGVYNLGGDDGDTDGYAEPSSGSASRERILWGGKDQEANPNPGGVGLW